MLIKNNHEYHLLIFFSFEELINNNYKNKILTDNDDSKDKYLKKNQNDNKEKLSDKKNKSIYNTYSLRSTFIES